MTVRNAHWHRVLTGDPRGTSSQRRRRMAALAAIGSRTPAEVLARNVTPKDEFAARVQDSVK